MPSGYAIHIGLNRTDYNRYGSTRYRPLVGCDAAATALAEMTRNRGFGSVNVLDVPTLITRERVEAELRSAAARARSGDLVVFTFAGHGDEVDDLDGDEPHDQAFVLHDRYLVDDAVYAILGTFDRGVRVVMVADCCYAGSIITNLSLITAKSAVPDSPPRQHGPFFLRAPVDAEVVLLSACRDTARTAAASDPEGLPPFTERLLRLVNGSDGSAPTTYEELATRIGGEARLFPMPKEGALRLQMPFTI